MEIPAFCTNPACGAVFGFGLQADNVRNLSLRGNQARCPVCGSWGDVPDGVFNITDGVLEVLSAPAITVERLRRMQSILDSVRQGATSPTDAVEALRSEAPELESYWQRIKSDPAALAGWITVLLVVLQLFLGGGATKITTDVEHTTNVLIQQCLQHPQPLRRTGP